MYYNASVYRARAYNNIIRLFLLLTMAGAIPPRASTTVRLKVIRTPRGRSYLSQSRHIFVREVTIYYSRRSSVAQPAWSGRSVTTTGSSGDTRVKDQIETKRIRRETRILYYHNGRRVKLYYRRAQNMLVILCCTRQWSWKFNNVRARPSSLRLYCRRRQNNGERIAQ